MGIARVSKKCPACGEYIWVGEKIAKQKIGKKIEWVHEACYKPRWFTKKRSRLAKETKKLDENFWKTVS